MNTDISKMTLSEKKTLLMSLAQKEENKQDEEKTLASFVENMGRSDEEVKAFNKWLTETKKSGKYTIETTRQYASNTINSVKRKTGEILEVLNFSNYNYLGYTTHPQVIQAAKDALDKYGLGANASPLASGMLDIHVELENELVNFFGVEGTGISLFTSGFGALVGAISAYMGKDGHIILDSAVHASILDGTLLSQSQLHYFYHNNMESLEDILKNIDDGENRILICTEGCFSVDGDYGKIKEVVKLAKQYGAKTLVDEAHSILISGPNGRGVCEEQNVLEEVDMVVGTFSKGFSGVGGFVLAQKEITNYINFYARNRMFSCALDPAVTGGMIKVLQLVQDTDGYLRRKRILENTGYMRSLLKGKVDIGSGNSWIIPVRYGEDAQTLFVADYLQKEGFDGPLMVFPAVPKNQGRIRIFVTSEHTREQIKKAVEIILKAAEKFGFPKNKT